MEWIDVNKQLPEIPYRKKMGFRKIIMTDGKVVKEGRFRYLFKHNEKKEMIAEPIFHTYCEMCLDGKMFKATHWMEMPSKPKEEKDE